MSARDDILALAMLEQEPLEGMPGAFIRRLSVADSEALAKVDPESKGLALFVQTVCSEDGEPLFTMKDAPKLKRLPLKTFNKFGRQIMVYNGLSDTSDEEAEKN